MENNLLNFILPANEEFSGFPNEDKFTEERFTFCYVHSTNHFANLIFKQYPVFKVFKLNLVTLTFSMSLQCQHMSNILCTFSHLNYSGTFNSIKVLSPTSFDIKNAVFLVVLNVMLTFWAASFGVINFYY